ncbi:MAG: efflux RND transporter periplasmic adaptor subunit [Muribaculaceae bacterium]|nr:efflux RND transporter periplasmic adaptor subunit [Muribaculaceae bacterium]
MKHYHKIIIPILAIAFACSCSEKQATVLETVTVAKGELSETVTATGTLESVTQVDVGTQVTGIISNLYADFNSEVKQGELIAEIEKTVLQSELQSAEASVKSAKATYEYNLANYNRDKTLYERQLISQYEFQTSTKDLEVSKQAYDKAVADRVRAAKNLNYAEIYSPIDGIVISRDVEVGQTVVSNMSVANLYTIADLDHMQVVADVDEADIGQVKVGQKVTFSVDAYSDVTFDGEVTQVRLSPTTESNVVTYEVIIATENPGHKLIPGLTANITIYTLRESGLLLPAKAFTFEPDTTLEDKDLPRVARTKDKLDLSGNRRCVWALENGTLVPKAVTIGQSNDINTIILDGINEGAVVATGYETPSNGDTKEQDAKRSPFAPQPPGGNKKNGGGPK